MAEMQLDQVARQLLALEQLFGGADFLPTERNPLPELDIQTAAPAPPTSAAASRPAGRPAAAAAPAYAATADLPTDPAGKAVALEAIDVGEVRPCTKCVLSRGRTQTVFGEGNPAADLVFVGEGPGAEEDKQGRPFVGRAGELLTKMIHAMGLTREDIFICNMVKCRPPNNRTPAPEEVQACWGYLVRQLQIIAPKVIVTLGNPATKGLLNTNVGITRMRGNWQRLPDIGEGLANIPVMPTYHPAFVLRQYSVENRQKVWSDLQAVMDLLGLTVPEKK